MAQAVTGIIPVLGGIAVYGTLAWLFRVPEARAFTDHLRRRVGRGLEPQE
jgi:hypothetical protein